MSDAVSAKSKRCQCGLCSETTDRDFAPGHDQKLRVHLENMAGGLLALKALVATSLSPENVVKQQLDAYNRRDIDAWLNTYAPDAVQRNLDGEELARGREAIRQRMAPRMLDPDLHATLLRRTVMGDVVIDHEIVTRNLPEGKATIEMVCIYVVKHGLIQSATFEFKKPAMVQD